MRIKGRPAGFARLHIVHAPAACAIPMNLIPQPAEPAAVDQFSPREFAALVDTARALQHAAQAGTTQPLLRGRKIGVLCAADDDGQGDIALLDRAAAELGAQVAHIRPHLTERSDRHMVKLTAQMLGRLYSAVVCQNISPALVQQLRADAGIPIYAGIMAPTHPIARAAEMLGGAADDRRFAMQAMLLKTIA